MSYYPAYAFLIILLFVVAICCCWFGIAAPSVASVGFVAVAAVVVVVFATGLNNEY
jgi:hypothetical protein